MTSRQGWLQWSYLGPALALVGCVACAGFFKEDEEQAVKAATAWAERNKLQDPVVECVYLSCTISHGEVGARRVEALHCSNGRCYR